MSEILPNISFTNKLDTLGNGQKASHHSHGNWKHLDVLETMYSKLPVFKHRETCTKIANVVMYRISKTTLAYCHRTSMHSYSMARRTNYCGDIEFS
jgi:hypothetical protein